MGIQKTELVPSSEEIKLNAENWDFFLCCSVVILVSGSVVAGYRMRVDVVQVLAFYEAPRLNVGDGRVLRCLTVER